MIVGVAVVEIFVHESQSLKAKRGVVRSIAARLRNRFNLSVSEVGGQGTWQRAVLGISMTGSEEVPLRRALEKAVEFVEGTHLAQVLQSEIEIIRLPTGAPMCRLHDRALVRANQLGMERIAVSISHEREFAVAIAFGIRTQGGEFVFPIDMEARMDDREKQLMDRMRALRDLDADVRAVEAETEARSVEADTSGGGGEPA